MGNLASGQLPIFRGHLPAATRSRKTAPFPILLVSNDLHCHPLTVCFRSSRAHRRRTRAKGSIPSFTEYIVSCIVTNIAPEAWIADVTMAGAVRSASYGCLSVRHPRSVRHSNTGANKDSLQKESLGASPRQVVSRSACSIPPCHVLYHERPVIDRSAHLMCRNPGGSTESFREVTDAYEVVSGMSKGSCCMTKLHTDLLDK